MTDLKIKQMDDVSKLHINLQGAIIELVEEGYSEIEIKKYLSIKLFLDIQIQIQIVSLLILIAMQVVILIQLVSLQNTSMVFLLLIKTLTVEHLKFLHKVWQKLNLILMTLKQSII